MLDTIEEFKTILENKGIKVYKATPKQTDIILSSYNDFSNLLTEFKVTHLFMNVKFFDESEFEDYFITDDLIENKYISNGILELIKDAVDKFNQTVSEKMNSSWAKK